MRHPLYLLPVLLLGACSLISPYTITFTNEPGEVIDPASSTLDLVVSAPTLAYISGVACEGAEELDILPVESKTMEVNTVHKLPLTLMEGQPSGASCEVTVTAYDRTTTDTASATIELTMAGIPLAEEGEMCGGIAGIQCAEGLSCDMTGSEGIADGSGTCVTEKVTQEEEKGEPAQAGEVCGGEAGIECASGYDCVTQDGAEVDAEGVCKEILIEDSVSVEDTTEAVVDVDSSSATDAATGDETTVQ
jgi:hypothetical protein